MGNHFRFNVGRHLYFRSFWTPKTREPRRRGDGKLRAPESVRPSVLRYPADLVGNADLLSRKSDRGRPQSNYRSSPQSPESSYFSFDRAGSGSNGLSYGRSLYGTRSF